MGQTEPKKERPDGEVGGRVEREVKNLYGLISLAFRVPIVVVATRVESGVRLWGHGAERIGAEFPLEAICKVAMARSEGVTTANDVRNHAGIGLQGPDVPDYLPPFVRAVPVALKGAGESVLILIGDSIPHELEPNDEVLSEIAGLLPQLLPAETPDAASLMSAMAQAASGVSSREMTRFVRAISSGSISTRFECEILTGRIFMSPWLERQLGFPADDTATFMLNDLRDRVHPADSERFDNALMESIIHGARLTVQTRFRNDVDEYNLFDVFASIDTDEQNVPTLLSGSIGPARSACPALSELTNSDLMHRKAIEASDMVVYHLDFESGQYAYMSDHILRLVGYPAEIITPRHSRVRRAGDVPNADENQVEQMISDFRAGKLSEWRAEYEVQTATNEVRYLVDRAVPVLDDQGNIVGSIGSLQDITDRVLAQQRLETQFARVTALRAIDLAILADNGISATMRVVFDQMVSELNVDAACFLQVDEVTGAFVSCAMVGLSEEFNLLAIAHEPDSPFASVFRGELLCGLDSANGGAPADRAALARNAGFSDYIAIPLPSHGEVRGVIEIFQRLSLPADPDWTDFLYALIGQASIAMDVYTLMCGLKKSNTELAAAYDTTIEGWAQTLDYRDSETTGHTRRVTDLTVQLARRLGVDGQDLVHMRWGALLHDIGKIAIPDRILLKSSGLTDDEMLEMQKHPDYAYRLLSSIPFLKDALDIPYCHHERWDGGGYPRGIRGEDIPFAARLFAAIDIYDAFRSNRPYRAAWPEAKVRVHLRELSGNHPDPAVVDSFLDMLDDENAAGGSAQTL